MEAATRLGWSIVALSRRGGVGRQGRDKRPGLDALLKGIARRESDVGAAWSVCRLGRSLSDLVVLLGEPQARDNPDRRSSCSRSKGCAPRTTIGGRAARAYSQRAIVPDDPVGLLLQLIAKELLSMNRKEMRVGCAAEELDFVSTSMPSSTDMTS